jgi:hypothetical protein
MKYITITLIYLTLFLVTIWLVGCGQLIVDRPDGSRLKINTLFMSTGLDGLYHDAEFTEVRGYEGLPADLKLRYNPVTGTVEVVTDSNVLERK